VATRDVNPLLMRGLSEAVDFLGQTYPRIGEKFYHQPSTNAGYDQVQHFNPYGTLPQPRGFGQGIQEASLSTGFAKTYYQVMYGLKDVIADELIRRDLYGMLTRWCTTRGGALAEIYATNDEISAVHVFKAGFASTTPAGGSPDGQPLFSANHPIAPGSNQVWSNVPPTNMPFSMPALQFARANLETQLKANGLTVWLNSIARVAFHPNIEEIVLQCLHSDWVPGTADLNMNTMKGRGIEPISWPYWQVSGATNPTAYNSWFVQGKVHHCKWYTLTPVRFDSQKILGINSTMFASFKEMVLGYDAAWGMAGSAST
jgi:hypothetical protein